MKPAYTYNERNYQVRTVDPLTMSRPRKAREKMEKKRAATEGSKILFFINRSHDLAKCNVQAMNLLKPLSLIMERIATALQLRPHTKIIRSITAMTSIGGARVQLRRRHIIIATAPLPAGKP